MRVLIVDDSRTMRRMIANCLSEFQDLTISEASNGAEAMLRLVDMRGADLILSDWNMPNQNGLQFLHMLAASSFKACPVIMVTSEAEKERVLEAVKAGAVGYVVKPFTADTLREKVKQVLVARSSAAPPAQ